VDPTRLNLEWDPDKAKQNLRKHGITFGQGATVLLDPVAINLYDEEHSREEDRWITLGRSSRGGILVIVHTFDEQSDGNIAAA
jgi:uncharacterized protein